MGDNTSPLNGKRILIVGRLKDKRKVVANAEMAGALFQTKLNSQTNIVLLPDDISLLQKSPSKTFTDIREMLKERSACIKIIKESDFIKQYI